MKTITLTVNGKQHTANVEPRTSIADFLREDLLLTGTHLGCEQGVCGACTINLNGMPVRACISFAVTCDGADIQTIEGFDDDPLMAEIRHAFSSEHGLQCGYCTPGMMITAHDIAQRLPRADEARLRIELSGNLCRCTGYVGIVNAMHKVLKKRLSDGSAFEPLPIKATQDMPMVSQTAQLDAPKDSPNTGAESIGKMTTLTQQFSVAHQRKEVWAMFQNLQRVTTCMPGATLTEPPLDNHIKGRMIVKLGPIRTNFVFEADIKTDSAAYTGHISASGIDSGHNSRARSEITYVLSETDGGNATQVSVEVAFALSGALAQFSRGGIVTAVADRMTQNFATNLEGAISNTDDIASPDVTTELDMGNIVLSVAWAKIKSIFRFLLRRD